MAWRFSVCIATAAMAVVSAAAADDRAPDAASVRAQLELLPGEAVVRAVEDLAAIWPGKYDAPRHLAAARRYAERRPAVLAALKKDETSALGGAADLLASARSALLANPLLDVDKLLVVRRTYGKSARQQAHPATPNLSCYTQVEVNMGAHPSELAVLSNLRGAVQARTLFAPPAPGVIVDVDLDFDARRLMYSGPGTNNRWHVHEVASDGKYLRQLTPADAEYDSFDSCYLPDGRVLFTSTAPMQGLPCEHGRTPMSHSYLLDPGSGKIRRLTFDQDSNWHPTMMEDGRVMYLRWEYSDLPHYFSRVLMTMMPDGTGQIGFYHTNSYWPNHIGMAKPIPGQPTRFVAVLTGHHAVRPGVLGLFDVSQGRREGQAAVQLLPGYGKPVEAPIVDGLYGGNWPKCMSPFPLGTGRHDGAGKYFLASVKPSKDALWGVYLVDVFDNFTLLYEQESCAINEPIPLAPTRRPPVIPDRVVEGAREASVYLGDIYTGPGLRGVPRGAVKSLRLFTYHFNYLKSGGHEAIGVESSWDVKRVLGTVGVAEDGSAYFTVPANTPISIQPLDERGAALQLMRSWFVGMPGEVVSCSGCHEDQNTIPPAPLVGRSAERIQPWLGPERNFSFLREVQPVLTRRCAGCHDGTRRFADGAPLPNLADLTPTTIPYRDKLAVSGAGAFTRSYHELNPYVRRPGPESDIRLLNPTEYHANTSPLIQMLRKGHHGLTLDEAEWQRLYAWIDLNAPFWGSWMDVHRNWGNEFHRKWIGYGKLEDHLKDIRKYHQLRNRYRAIYENWDAAGDPELESYDFERARQDLAGVKPVLPPQMPAGLRPALSVEGWPFGPEQAARMQQALGETRLEIDVPGAGKMAFVRIPAGRFVMGDAAGQPDETPFAAAVEKPFWVAEREVTNAQYRAMRADHYSGYVDTLGKDHHNPGLDAGQGDQPVVRVSFDEAVEFCRWLSQKTGRAVTLPTETQWEWAARSGSDRPFYWGGPRDDFGPFANLADKTLDGLPNQRQTHNYVLRAMEFSDGRMIQAAGGKLKPNAFGLHEMIGNVAEWTRSAYRPYPCAAGDGREEAGLREMRVTRGGAWDCLPRWARAALRTPYHPWQRVHNVGLRLVIE